MLIENDDDDENQPSIRCKVRNAAAWEHLKESIVSSPRILLLHPILTPHHHDLYDIFIISMIIIKILIIFFIMIIMIIIIFVIIISIKSTINSPGIVSLHPILHHHHQNHHDPIVIRDLII